MNYVSTRGMCPVVSSAEAIKMGIAPDGGLFVPESPVAVDNQLLDKMLNMSYGQRAVEILGLYLTDYTREELSDCTQGAYNSSNFDHPDIAPVVHLEGSTYIQELWHGPTSAFKDMALQILPRFLPRAAAKTGEKGEIVILVATSGDTGKAALEGFKDVSGTRIIVFYPEQGVSQVQRLQMVTQEGGNVAVAAVQGNFDDAQSGVKAIFTNTEINSSINSQGYIFSSANSINWGRLAPQVVYYFSAYLDLLKEGRIKSGEKINFVVPTGNFGNILAGYYARQAGLPIKRLICASNSNNVLTDFINSGVYDRQRHFYKTLSPSMDILISSNLERLLYQMSCRDHGRVREWMKSLTAQGTYQVGEEMLESIRELFWAGYAGDPETLATIKNTFDSHGYVPDTHTAVGLYVYDRYRETSGDETVTVVVSTASPFKFNGSVARALLGDAKVEGRDEFELLATLASVSGLEIPQGLKDLDKKTVLHSTVVKKEAMAEQVMTFLGIGAGA